MQPQHPRRHVTSSLAWRRTLCPTLLVVALLLQGANCPETDQGGGDPATPADFGEVILIEQNPIVVAQGSQVSVGLDFRSRRQNLFFVGFDVDDLPAGMDASFDETRRSSVTPA